MDKSSRNKSRLLPPRILFKCRFYAMAEYKKKWKIPARTKTINETGKHSALSHFLKHHTESGLKFFYRLVLIPWHLWIGCWLSPASCFDVHQPTFDTESDPPAHLPVLGVPSSPFQTRGLMHTVITETCSVCSLLEENIHPNLRQMKVILERIVREVHRYKSMIIKTSNISTAIVEGFALLTFPTQEIHSWIRLIVAHIDGRCLFCWWTAVWRF